jgi:hypothetical protein
MRLACAALLLAAGCASTPDEAGRSKSLALRVTIDEIGQNYNTTAQRAAREIIDGARDPAFKRQAVQYEIATLAACRRARLFPNPLMALLELWTMAVQRRNYLAGEEARTLLGDGVGIARAAETAMASFIERAARDVLPADAHAAATAEVDAFAAAHPMEEFQREWNTGQHPSRGASVFAKVVKFVPSLGIKDTAGSITEVAESIDAIGDVIQDFPQVTRWQTQLLLYDLDENDSVLATRRNFERISESVARFTEIADGMPARLQAEVSKTLDEIDTKQEGLRKTLEDAEAVAKEAGAAVRELRATVKDAEGTVASVERAAAGFARAGEAWEPAIAELGRITGPASTGPKEPGPDPNIENLARAAESFGATAKELHAALVEVRGILQGGEVDQVRRNAQGTIDHTTDRVRGLVDHVTWRAVQLVLAIAAVALLYRLATRRLPRAPAA